MRDLINKFFKKEKKINQFFSQFQKLRHNTDVEKIFKSISAFSNNSEARYVGGCIRKILNKEKVDDIDLAANINPKMNVSFTMQNLFGSIPWPETFTNLHEFSINIVSDELEEISDYNDSEMDSLTESFTIFDFFHHFLCFFEKIYNLQQRNRRKKK